MKTDPERLKMDAVAMIRNWVGKLAAEDYRGALEMLLQRVYTWDESTLAESIAEYSIDYFDASEDQRAELRRAGCVPKVTPLSEMNMDEEYVVAIELRGPQLLMHIDYDLPIDGEWSDLSASFDIHVVKGQIQLDLRGILVM